MKTIPRMLDLLIQALVLVVATWLMWLVVILGLAAPLAWLWNHTLASMGLPRVGYWRALGLLAMWHLLHLAGVRMTAERREP